MMGSMATPRMKRGATSSEKRKSRRIGHRGERLTLILSQKTMTKVAEYNKTEFEKPHKGKKGGL